MKLFRLDASIRTTGSVSRTLADTAEQAWLAEHPHATVIRRDLGRDPLPTNLWSEGALAAIDPTAPRPEATTALVTELGEELLTADVLLFAVPLYNWGVPAQVKNWLDLVFLHPRLGIYGDQPLAGRPAVLTLSRGGGYGPGTPKEGWDYTTPYLRRMLGEVLGLDLHVAEAELTLAEVNPAMAELRPLAATLLQRGHEQAAAHATKLARV